MKVEINIDLDQMKLLHRLVVNEYLVAGEPRENLRNLDRLLSNAIFNYEEGLKSEESKNN